MRTPSGRDCSYYYEDDYRGSHVEECRISRLNGSRRWERSQCARCPVPDIERDNGSPYLRLRLFAGRGMFGLGRRFRVEASCVKHGPVRDPHVGCLECSRDLFDLEP